MDDDVGQVARQRLDVELQRVLGEDAALGDAGGLVGALDLQLDRGLDRLVEVHPQEVHVHVLAADGVALQVLDDDGLGAAAVEGEVQDRAGLGERVAQEDGVDLEGAGLIGAAVDDAGDEPAAAQAARGARALDGARGDGEGGRVGSGHEGASL